jgi:hypothetical protein
MLQAKNVSRAGGRFRELLGSATSHRSVQMVRRYIRDAPVFRDNSAWKLGCRTARILFVGTNTFTVLSR